jgi:putative radical SAM enzyme (TIGR03279 family)
LSDGLVVSRVLSGSIAAEMEIEAGDMLLEVCGKKIEDVLDLQYYTADDEFTLLVEKPSREVWELEIVKEPGETLGIEVKAIGAQGLKKCRNKCVFCFVEQMPPGMRESLYDRDDDYRLSFMQGSYITLSNLTEAEFRRIIALHLSPLYISVHAWDGSVREKLMQNRRVGRLAAQIQMLAEAGLMLHTQIVLVPGYNDGEILAESVKNLAAFYPAVQSIGIVPVGLTRYREKLSPLRTVSREEAKKILDEGRKWQQEFRAATGKNLVYFSDEFYALAQRPFPGTEDYDDFPQVENGIGMAAQFESEIIRFLAYLPLKVAARSVHIVTGVSAFGFFSAWARKLSVVQGLNITVHQIENRFFGPTVTVAGLLTAQDIACQLGDVKGDYFLIPKVMLKADEAIFLDDYGIEWLERQVNGRAVVVENNGKAFLEGLCGISMEVQEFD